MKRSGVWASVLALGIAVGGGAWALGQAGQSDQLPPPSPIEKTLADRAKHVTEVTLDKNMLAFASKFMDKDDEDEGTKEMVKNLRGVYVREYEFDKDHSYTSEELEGLRKYMQGSDWSPMVHERTKGSPEATDVYVKLIDGKMQGLYVLDAEERELSLVLILGPIDVDKLSDLGGNFGIPKAAAKSLKKAAKEAGK
ncbi:MAG TPA: DUF4252 domain-containing protein [Acidobacteriaceae bacterium]|jgi:hypothetical protein|nr:DUF4252 domain-containing protein [Acidobacteriaceae bacterium]